MVGGTDNMPVFNTFPLYDRLYFYGQFIFVLLKKIHRINCRNIQHFAYNLNSAAQFLVRTPSAWETKSSKHLDMSEISPILVQQT